MADKVTEAYAVFDSELGIAIETLSDTPFKAAQSLSNRELYDPTDQMLRLMGGKLKVHRVRIEVLDAVDPSPPKKT